MYIPNHSANITQVPTNDDLCMRCPYNLQPSWEKIPSINVGYYSPNVEFHSTECHVYLQGYIYNVSGKALSIEEFADLIIEQGSKVLDDIDGSFVLAVTDIKRGIAWCANDPAGTLPLYYQVKNDFLFISISPLNFRMSSNLSTLI